MVSLSPGGESRSAGNVSLSSLFGFGASGTSVVNHETALTIPALFNGVDQISNDIAKLPKGVYRKIDNGREEVKHRIKYLINKEPNRQMDAFTFHKIMTQAAILRGNGLAVILRHPNTAALESLVFIHPDDIRDIRMIKGDVYYITKYGTFTSDEVIHIMGYTDNGWLGKSVIRYAAETLGIAKSAQSFAACNFDNRGIGYGVVHTDNEVSPEGKQKIEAGINAKMSIKDRFRTAVIDEGMKYEAISVSAQDAQLIEQSKFSVIDICRFLNISPRKVKDYTINNYASAYQDATDHVTDSIQPWSKKFENEYDRKLFTATEKEDHYVKFNDNYLLRGDLTAKSNYYFRATAGGWMTINEVRAMEELNPIDGGDEPLIPMNMQQVKQLENSMQDEK